MKKVSAIVAIMCVMLCGCGGGRDVDRSNIPNVTFDLPKDTPTPTEIPTVKTDSYGTKYLVQELPFECQYNDTTFSIKEIQYLSAKNGKSNELIVLVVLDVANIPDGDDLEWFYEDLQFPKTTESYGWLYTGIKDELTAAYLTNEKNDVKSGKLYLDGTLHYTDTKELYCFFSTVFLDDARYPYEDCHLAINISTKQEEKAKSDYGTQYKINRAIYEVDITKDDITPLSKAKKGVKDFVTKHIGKDYK